MMEKLSTLRSTQYILLALVMFTPPVTPKTKFEVTSTQPVIMGSSVTFTTILTGPEDNKVYDISWNELLPYGESVPRRAQGNLNKENHYTSTFTLDYPAEKDTNSTAPFVGPGTYTVSAQVTYQVLFFTINVGTQLAYYNITRDFQGALLAVQPDVKKKSSEFISTANETSLEVELHDPNKYLAKAVNTTWSWYNSTGGFMANTTTPVLRRNITKGGDYSFNVTLTALYNGAKPNTTFVQGGFFEANFTAKAPVSNFTVVGETWFPHGKLLNLKVLCDGSAPFTYCMKLYTGPYNLTGNETCFNAEGTNDCEIPYIWYFSEPGLHSLVIIIDNDVSRLVNRTLINIYKVGKKQPISIIIVPITCSLLAVVMIVFGIAYFCENRARFNVEVADFDFGQNDELPYMTFVERLKDAMTSTTSSRQRLYHAQDEEPIVNSRRPSQFS